jgi:sec-independent protein translocase protein TatA
MVGGPQLIIILVIILVLFGGSKLPQLARSLGQAQGEFKKGIEEGETNAAAAAAEADADDSGTVDKS